MNSRHNPEYLFPIQIHHQIHYLRSEINNLCVAINDMQPKGQKITLELFGKNTFGEIS